jgi:uncharacterized protein
MPVLLLGGLGHAAAIDCKTVKTPAERAICRSKPLAALDAQMSAAYDQLLGIVGQAVQRDQVIKDQVYWVSLTREACGAKIACLTSSYQKRINELNGMVAKAKSGT